MPTLSPGKARYGLPVSARFNRPRSASNKQPTHQAHGQPLPSPLVKSTERRAVCFVLLAFASGNDSVSNSGTRRRKGITSIAPTFCEAHRRHQGSQRGLGGRDPVLEKIVFAPYQMPHFVSQHRL